MWIYPLAPSDYLKEDVRVQTLQKNHEKKKTEYLVVIKPIHFVDPKDGFEYLLKKISAEERNT